MNLLDRQLEHDHWATTQLLNLSGALTGPRLDQAFDIGHQTRRETLDHLIFVINIWTAPLLTITRSW